MPLLPSLIKRVDEFFKVAERYSLVSLGVDDRTLLAELTKATNETVNPEVSYNLRILGAMYQKALEINGGFNTIYKAIQGMVEDMDPDEEETEPVENLLNQIASSIKTRAARPDSTNDVRELQMAATAARTEESPFSYDEPEGAEEGDDVSAYEASLLGYSGGAEEAFKDAGGVSQFDMTGGVSAETAQSGTGRGYSVGKAHSLKDWAAIYANERDKYDRDLNGPAEMLSPTARKSRNDPRIQSNLDALVKILDKLSKLTVEALQLRNRIDIETEVQHPKEEARLLEIQKELEKLEHERGLLKRNLSKFYKTSELDTLKERVNTPGLNLKEKRLLEERIKLQELRTSGKYGYGREAKERARLIAALTADPNLSDEQFRKMDEAIGGAARFTDEMTKRKYDRIRTEQKMQQAGRGIVPERDETKGRGGGQAIGWKSLYQVDYDKATYPTLLKRFRDLNNTIVSDAKKYVVRPNEKGDPALAPYVEALSLAIKKKDNAAKFMAINNLKAAIKQTLVAAPSLRGYLWAIRLAPHFKTIEEFLYNIKDKQNAAGVWNLSEAEKSTLKNAAEQLTRMQDIYNKYFPKKGGRYGRSHYMTSVDFYPKLINYIYENILQEKPESLGATAQNGNTMISKRLEIFGQIMAEEKIRRMAQEVGAQPNEIGDAEADQLAKDIFDKLFDEELKSLLQS